MNRELLLDIGMDVIGADGEKVGTIAQVEPDYIVVEKGFFFPKDYYIPAGAIQTVDGDDVFLTVTKDEALNQAWDTVPEAAYTAGAAETAVGARDSAAAEVIAADYTAEADASETAATDGIRVPVYEEDLSAVKRPVERGAVRIEKELVTEDRTITVPVTEERIRVTRVDADAPANAAEAFQEGVIDVPLHGEEVEVRKTARQTGEVVVEKEAVQRTERVGGTVRREEVHVDDQTVDPEATAR